MEVKEQSHNDPIEDILAREYEVCIYLLVFYSYDEYVFRVAGNDVPG